MSALNESHIELILETTGASGINATRHVQTLWSGYGQIIRIELSYADTTPSGKRASVVIKHIRPPKEPSHPRGWHSDVSMSRKLKSYRVETFWYSRYASMCHDHCAMPTLVGKHVTDNEILLVLEDLSVEFPVRHSTLSPAGCQPCLEWLARFHALHMHGSGEGLWPTGSYWHLQTRKEELNAMREGVLKEAAPLLDKRLEQCEFKTLIHGDAKVANICFSADSTKMAMVDFQYVGRGCGMRDVAYFLGSCLDAEQCEQYADQLLRVYFNELNRHLPATIQSRVEREWQSLYAIAWADFHRFLAGWMPDHQKINRYALMMTERALSEL